LLLHYIVFNENHSLLIFINKAGLFILDDISLRHQLEHF
jgi:hypothetical protein